MNTNTPIPDPATVTADTLRAEVAQLEKVRQQIASDMEALRQKESNLRSYEGRLRDSHSPIPPAAPVDQATLDAERDKLSRLRALTEGERRALIDERLAVREEKMILERKAAELKQREAWLNAREKDFEEKAAGRKAKNGKTTAPFTAAKFFSFGSKRTPVA